MAEGAVVSRLLELDMILVMGMIHLDVKGYSLVKDVCPARRAAGGYNLESFAEEDRFVLE